MAPKKSKLAPPVAGGRNALADMFAGRKPAKIANVEVPPVATPQSKSPPVAEADITPEGPAKRRKVDDVEITAEKPVVAKVETAVSAAPAAAPGPLSDTGPWSLWGGAPGPDKKVLSSTGFDPSLRAADFPIGKPIGFALVSDALVEIEDLKGSGQGSRKKSTVILSNLFRTILHSRPEELVPTIYILCNKVAPDYEESELGIGDGILVKTIGEVFGRSEKQIKESMAVGDAQDLGEVALLSRVAQKVLMMPPKLMIEKVFADMKKIANISGANSGKFKKDIIQKMLVGSRGAEAKYIVRMLQSKLRIGIQIPTVLQAIAFAFVLTQPVRPGAALVPDTRKGQTPEAMEARMITMESAVKQAYCELPNIDRLIAALTEGRTGETLAEACHISLGIPVKPMLAKPSKGIGEVADRLTGTRFTGEWKYDGERAQIHVVSRKEIYVYSRNSENMTEKYPDVIKVIQETLCDDVESCIIDSELVAYDQVSGKILPFQILSTRGRKNIEIENIKVNVCVFAFDLMLHNGTPHVKTILEKRRDLLWKTLKETEGKVKFATYRNFDATGDLDTAEVQTFLDESIAGSCEGLMLKTLETNATYAPSKRSLNWLKLKKDYLDGCGDSLDVVPIGAFFGKGKRTGAYGAFLLAIWNPEQEEYQTVCKAGTGFSDEDLTTHYEFFKTRKLDRCPTDYNVHDRLKPDVWLQAAQVWEIKCADLSISPVHTSALGQKADGKGIGLRFPRFLRIRDDKTPEDSTGPDQIVDMFESQASVGQGGGGGDEDDF